MYIIIIIINVYHNKKIIFQHSLNFITYTDIKIKYRYSINFCNRTYINVIEYKCMFQLQHLYTLIIDFHECNSNSPSFSPYKGFSAVLVCMVLIIRMKT